MKIDLKALHETDELLKKCIRDMIRLNAIMGTLNYKSPYYGMFRMLTKLKIVQIQRP